MFDNSYYATYVLISDVISIIVLFFSGLLPPIDCVFSYVLEQGLVYLCAASPSSNDLRYVGPRILLKHRPLSEARALVADICAFLLEQPHISVQPNIPTSLHTKTTAVENGVALSYHKVREQYFLAVVFAAIMQFRWGWF